MLSSQESHSWKLDQLTIPTQIYHLQAGNTLCSNDQVVVLQNGSTTIEFRIPPKFQSKRIPWRFGLVRDIVWSSQIDGFLLLTRDALHSINPKPLFVSESARNKSLEKFSTKTYKQVKPFSQENLFWRCTCVGTTLFITYAGYGTTVEEYSLETPSGKWINRWTCPETCASYEGIWCMRHHPETDQLALVILNSQDNQWRLEVRSRQGFPVLWSIGIPIWQGDLEISPLSQGDWLIIESRGIRLLHISNQCLKVVVEYLRELRNALKIGNLYFIIRTKNTLEIHENK